MSIEENPFASPPEIDDDAVVEVVGEAEQIRRQYLRHERAIQSVGSLYDIGGIFLLACALVATFAAFGTAGSAFDIGRAVFFGCIAAVHFAIGRGLNALAPWAAIPVGVLSTIGLLACPIGGVAIAGFSPIVLVVGLIGTVINSYILYLIFGRKGQVVFSPEYREVIRQTPHVKHKSFVLTR